MNDILHLKGKFEQKERTNRPSGPKLPKNAIVSIKEVEELCDDLLKMESFWSTQTIFS
ncbi:TPA: hypothetical protein U0F37_003116, partial [Listeria monocytogenes]|nr:hypothetical protein [Listeria monocytogenes]